MLLNFQIIDISYDDVCYDEDNKYNRDFTITFYGKTQEGENVVCNVLGYEPYFYMRVPDSWTESFCKNFIEKTIALEIPENQRYFWKDNYLRDKFEIVKSYNFYGYNYEPEHNRVKRYKFAKISFKSNQNMNRFINCIKRYYKNRLTQIQNQKYDCVDDDDKIIEWFNQEHNCECSANLYESKIHPMLRFLHEKNIDSCGWVTITYDEKNKIDKDSKEFNVLHELKVSKDKIKRFEKDSTAPFISCSFDIECDSSHGDFPNPKKNFKQLSVDIYEEYFRQSINGNPIDFKKKNIEKWIQDAFLDEPKTVQKIYTSNGTYNNLDKILEKLDEKFFEDLDDSKISSKKRDEFINQFAYILDLLENSSGERLEVKGDPIIQIGSVFHRFGEKESYERTMVIIGNEDLPDEEICDPIENVTIYRCSNERDLLLKWRDLILYHNPDILTGYNIFGFDFDYINKRVDYLFPCHKDCSKKKNCCDKCLKNEFYRMGRLLRNNETDIIKKEDIDQEDPIDVGSTCEGYNKYWEKRCKVTSKELSSSGLGDNILKYISMDGRIVFDIQKEIQKGHALDSYKLDNVSAHFMKGKIISKKFINDIKENKPFTILKTSNIGNLKENDYITFQLTTKYGNIKYRDGKKFKIFKIHHQSKNIVIHGYINVFKKYGDDLIFYEWCLAKDDVSPQQIFDFHKRGGPSGRAKVAKYCIMDCELCIHLLLLLDLIPNNMGMATVSYVPLSYIFLRGQGIKINSLVTKVCSEKNTRIPTLLNFNEREESNDGFEGAIVLEPEPGIYLDDPVSVLDYASLYPSSIIEKNISHETFICTKEELENNPEKYKWLDLNSKDIECIEYDDYNYELIGKTTHKTKANTTTTCYFHAPKDGVEQKDYPKGIVPTILNTLLEQRRNTRKRIKLTDDEDKKKVLDGLQLAYKVTANSVYGQMGAKTSSISFKKLAACTTAIGRQRIYDARDGVKEWAIATGHHPPEVVYGDTDSVFVKFSRIHKDTGEILKDKEALRYCIDCGVAAGEWITDKKMNNPQDLEYEKTFYPFILISKKRYTGDKYEIDHKKPKERTSMGIVMKRRDNAAIVKYVFGNVIEIIMQQRSVDLAIEWLEKTLKEIKDGEISESMFIISKSLRGYYKNPEGIAHKVLADRMAERNPGNKPKPNDRIPYMYRVVEEKKKFVRFKQVSKKVETGEFIKSGKNKGKPKYKTIKENGEAIYKKEKILQGDRIEHPDFIKENDIKIDYNFYITNQIMNPVKQVLDLEKDEKETDKIFKDYISK